MTDYTFEVIHISWIWLAVIIALFSFYGFFIGIGFNSKKEVIFGFILLSITILIFTAFIRPEDPYYSLPDNPYIHHIYLMIIMAMIGGWILVARKWIYEKEDEYYRIYDEKEWTKNYGE
jgi:hypothetical protein